MRAPRSRSIARSLVVALAAVAAATWVRGSAVRELPVDYDELDYLPAAFRYAERLEAGRWAEIPAVRENAEHPPLVKLLYGAELRRTGAHEPDWESKALDVGKPVPAEAREAFAGPRRLSAAAGALQVLLAAIVAPLGALWLAFDTYHAKYTAQAYLDGVPGLLAIVAILLAERGLRLGRAAGPSRRAQGLVELGSPGDDSAGPSAALLLLSAVALGLTCAGKYLHGLAAGLAIAPFLLVVLRRRPALVAAYAAVALLAFVAADPALWRDPVGAVRDAFAFHWKFATGPRVAKAGLPWWQPLAWLTQAAPARWHPGTFPVSWLDPVLLAPAALGIVPAWRRRPLWLAWAFAGLLFLLVWPTKWPQYTVVIRPALAVLAGMGLGAVAGVITARFGSARRDVLGR